MLSESSYRQLRFEGRLPEPRKTRVAAPRAANAPAPRVAVSPRRPEPELTADEQRLVAGALAAARLDASAYRSVPFRRRLPAVLRSLRMEDAAAAAERVADNSQFAERALDTLLIGHTEPFRDTETFAELRQQVLPALTAGRRGLSVWSVGCSSGVELLSVAALLVERGVIAESRLRGSDCRAAAIAEAKRTALPRVLAAGGALSDLGAPLPVGWCETPEFVAAVERVDWRLEDAMAAEPAGPWDLVLCRNLTIYLDEAASRELWTRLVGALAPGGVLVTGKAEKPSAGLPLVRLAKSIYRREDSSR